MWRSFAVVVVGLLVVGGAAAATPRSGVFRVTLGEGGGELHVAGRKIAPMAIAPSMLKCNRLNAHIPKAIAIAPNGSFSYTGPLSGQPGTVTLKGTFVSATTVKGTTLIVRGACRSSVSWSGRLLVGLGGSIGVT